MLFKRYSMVLGIFVLILTGVVSAQLQPEASVATPYISYNTRSFLVNGKPQMIFSAEIDYLRVPRELWHDRLMRLKRAGYNSISFYVFWSAHEPVQGQFHFEDNLDIDAWLTAIQDVGMYAIARVGPYVCGEWDFGGFPAWLADVPGISLRNANTQFVNCTYAYYNQIFPKLIKHQINRGGTLIAIQLENEYWPGSYGSAGTPDPVYKQNLIDKAKSLGMEVPYIWSFCNNGSEPVPTPFASGPWFSTESWTGWIQGYGEPSASYVTQVERGTWKIISGGTTGVTHYMAHGGTNFGYGASDDQRITSYDYYAPVGELGQLRSDYWLVKQAAYFTRSFNNILSTSTNGAALISTPSSGLTAYVNQSTSGNIAVLTNTNSAAASFKVNWISKGNLQVPTTFNWSLPLNKFAHFLSNVPISENDTINYSATNILSVSKLGTTNYIICYGRINKDTTGQIALSFKTPPSPLPAAPWVWNAATQQASLTFTYPNKDTVIEASINEGNGQKTSLLIIDSVRANHTWVDSNFIVIGPEYVDDKGNLFFTSQGGRAYIYKQGLQQTVSQPTYSTPANKPLISGWSWRSAALETGTTYNDSLWQQSANPKTMGSYGWPNGYGWYRTTYSAAAAGTATLTLPTVEHAAFVFVNGTYYSGSSIPLVQGKNTIAILVGQYSRWKAYNYYDIPTDVCKSGLLGNVLLNGTALTNWRFRGGFEGFPESPMMGTIDTTSWSNFLAGQWTTTTAPANNLPKFWRIDFNYTPPSNTLETWSLRSTIARAGRGVVWLNGHCLGRNLESQPPLFVPQCWMKGTNTLIVLVENGVAPLRDTLGLVEFRSMLLVNGLVETRKNNQINTENKISAIKQSVFTFTGNKFILPYEYSGKKVLVAVYDISGKTIENTYVDNGILKLGTNGKVSTGIHVVRLTLVP